VPADAGDVPAVDIGEVELRILLPNSAEPTLVPWPADASPAQDAAGSRSRGEAATGDEGPVVPEEISQKVDAFRQRLSKRPTSTSALAFEKDGRTVKEVSIEPLAMDLAAILMLHSACTLGNVELVTRLVEARTNPDAEDESGATPLDKACIGASPAVAEALLKRGASANARPGAVTTPLHRAAVAGGAEGERLVQLLLDHRANPRAMDHHGRTAAETHGGGGGGLAALRMLKLLEWR